MANKGNPIANFFQKAFGWMKIFEPQGKYSAGLTIEKALKTLLFYGVPFVIAEFLGAYPGIASLTVGSVLTAFANWVKQRSK